jgi:hypothetical protein
MPSIVSVSPVSRIIREKYFGSIFIVEDDKLGSVRNLKFSVI